MQELWIEEGVTDRKGEQRKHTFTRFVPDGAGILDESPSLPCDCEDIFVVHLLRCTAMRAIEEGPTAQHSPYDLVDSESAILLLVVAASFEDGKHKNIQRFQLHDVVKLRTDPRHGRSAMRLFCPLVCACLLTSPDV